MLHATRLAGIVGAHAIWSLSELAEGESLVPLLAQADDQGAVTMGRLMNEEGLEPAIAHGLHVLDTNPDGASQFVLAWQDHMSVGELDSPCIVLDVRDAATPEARLRLAVPFDRHGGLRLHPVRVLAMEKCGDVQAQALLEAFFSGVGRHQQGAAVWKQATADRG